MEQRIPIVGKKGLIEHVYVSSYTYHTSHVIYVGMVVMNFLNVVSVTKHG